MITRMRGPLGERIYDGEIGCFVEAGVIPCHRCGVCCELWQPLVAAPEVERLAAHLAITGAEVTARYTEPYPFDDASRLLRHADGGCIFLRRDGDGRSSCSVHPARPDACRDWTASLFRRECTTGLARFGDGAVLLPMTLYPNDDERHEFLRVARGRGRCGDA
jgi:Fe-S-cluster containining protein